LAVPFGWLLLSSPTSATSIRATATIVRFGSYETENPWPQPRIVVIVDIAGVGRRTLIESSALMQGCETGDKALILGFPARVGGYGWRFPLQGCQRLPPESAGR